MSFVKFVLKKNCNKTHIKPIVKQKSKITDCQNERIAKKSLPAC